MYKEEDTDNEIYEDEEGSEKELYEDKGIGGEVEEYVINNSIDGGNDNQEKAEDVSSNIKEIEIIY